MLHPVFLPFSEEQLLLHFADVNINGKCQKNIKHLEYYKRSIKRYDEFLKKDIDRKGKPLNEIKLPCQIEKDERFWIANCMMNIFYSNTRSQELISLFSKAYGEIPPFKEENTWEECFEGELYLFFEVNLPSPPAYKKWLKENLEQRQIITYILDSAVGKKNLEGATNIDAMILNANNGFAVIIEAKVLSDISCQTTFDALRNQIARIIDVMLEKNDNLCCPLNKRNPKKTLFLLITPKIFKNNPTSRLYGYKLTEYKNRLDTLLNEFPYRDSQEIKKLPDKLGWLTWEDFNEVNQNCCPWLN
ncbi:hypothetical protein [Thermodesulfatator autotrophicus]|uniref:Uncharacterized protein n=1 Tax=Thermodesulfatator autotrophicus TaxID=1795632 RepID=A0A177E8N1_9BACT|nr:hypothetical protein [Thermodesulfatator autotrophicus]OAG28148.1 hypothetical protein TH606_03140 [Thermodesulfatator autotrophicus]